MAWKRILKTTKKDVFKTSSPRLVFAGTWVNLRFSTITKVSNLRITYGCQIFCTETKVRFLSCVPCVPCLQASTTCPRAIVQTCQKHVNFSFLRINVPTLWYKWQRRANFSTSCTNVPKDVLIFQLFFKRKYFQFFNFF